MCVSQQQQTGGGLGKQDTHRTDSGTQFGISRLSPAQTAPWPGTSSLLGSGKQAVTVTCAFRTLREPRGLGRSREGRRAQTAHSANEASKEAQALGAAHLDGWLGKNCALGRSGAQWGSIHLPTQGAWVQSLTQEGPTCDRETVSLCALEPELQDKRCHREEPAHRNRAESPSPQLEKRPEGPAQPKPNE